MAGFLDHVLRQLHSADNLATLLKGTPDSGSDYPRLKRLVTEVYSTTEGNSLVKITDVTVLAVQPMRPLASLESIELTWQQQHPRHMTADLRGCLKRTSGEVWADLYANVKLQTMLSLERGGGPQSAITQTIGNTIRTELHLSPPSSADHTVNLDIAFAVIEECDLSAGLRAAQRMRVAGAAEPPRSADPLLGHALRPFAVAVVLPAAPAGQPDPAAVESLFAAAGVLPLFASNP